MFPFYYELLSKEGKKVYDSIFNGLMNGKMTIYTDLSRLRSGELLSVINAVLDDCPEFYCNGLWKCEYSGEHITFKTPIFSIFKSNEDMRFLHQIAQTARRVCSTDYEKVKYIHDFLINSVKFDYDEVYINAFDQRNHQAIGALYTGKSVCEGIARLTQLLLQMCGVTAIYCIGRTTDNGIGGDGGGHAWNVVRINDKFYYLDVSHDVCLTKYKDRKSYAYFNLTYDDITRDHTLDFDEAFRKLKCDSLQHNYFYYNNRFFYSLNDLARSVESVLENAVSHRSPSVYFDFKISDRLMKSSYDGWYNSCMTAIYQAIDRIESRYRVGVGFDSPYYVEKQGVLEINFTFAY